MGKACKRCEILETCKYWHDLPATEHHFFKILLGDFKEQLRIPRKFKDYFNGKLSGNCILRGPSGKEWKVKVEKTVDDVAFTDGWRNFVKDNRLQISDFLVFSYISCSSFKVLMFDATGCEREGSHFAKIGESSGMIRSACPSSLHVENSDSLMEENGMNENGSKASSEECNRESLSPSSESSGTAYKRKGKAVNMSESEYEEEEDNGEFAFPIAGKDRPSHKKRGRRESSRGKQPQTYHISNRRRPTDTEKAAAETMAASHMARLEDEGLPTFKITMTPTHVYKGFHVAIPKEWACSNMLQEDHVLELQVLGKTWPVKCRWSPSQCHITAKWSKFVLGNNLEEHDVCLFALIKKGQPGGKKNPVFQVHIFRAIDEVVPLTKERGVLVT